MKEIGVGIIGAGGIGLQHLDALRRVPGVRVVAACQRDEERLGRICDLWNIPHRCTRWQDLIDDPAVEVVHNCTPNLLHDEVNRRVIQAGKHIYAEKPLSGSASEALAIWRLAREKGVAHGLNHQYRLNAAVQDMHHRVASGHAGRVFFAHGHYLQESNAMPGQRMWRTSAQSGISYALADIGIHWVDTAVCVLGRKLEQVCADFTTVHAQRTGLDERVEPAMLEDIAALLLRFEDGTPGALTASKASLGHKNELCLSVDAQNYGMRWEQEKPDRLWLGHRDQPNEEIYISTRLAQERAMPYITTPAGHTMGWADALRNAMVAFYGAVRSGDYARGPVPYATFESGYHGMAFVEACIKSHQEKRWVALERGE